jgi:hypothetical protein
MPRSSAEQRSAGIPSCKPDACATRLQRASYHLNFATKMEPQRKKPLNRGFYHTKLKAPNHPYGGFKIFSNQHDFLSLRFRFRCELF